MRTSTAAKPMVALSTYQPWATFLSLEIKRFETRGWYTRHRGAIAVHAGATWSRRMARQCCEEPFRMYLRRAGFAIPTLDEFEDLEGLPTFGLPFGAVLAVADLVDVKAADEIRGEVSDLERAFGDFNHGRYGFRYERVRCLPQPIFCGGRQRLFRLGPAVELMVITQLEEAHL